jgi:hypothetical protein
MEAESLGQTSEALLASFALLEGVRLYAERKKAEDWRKQKGADGGSIHERDGKIYARIQYFGVDGKPTRQGTSGSQSNTSGLRGYRVWD